MVIEVETCASGISWNSVSISSMRADCDADFADLAPVRAHGRNRIPSAWADQMRRKVRSVPARANNGNAHSIAPRRQSRVLAHGPESAAVHGGINTTGKRGIGRARRGRHRWQLRRQRDFAYRRRRAECPSCVAVPARSGVRSPDSFSGFRGEPLETGMGMMVGGFRLLHPTRRLKRCQTKQRSSSANPTHAPSSHGPAPCRHRRYAAAVQESASSRNIVPVVS